jgi:LPS sulfotransferase NodH
MRVKYQYYKRIVRRSIEKRLGGYFSEAKLNITYPFRSRRESNNKFFIFTHQRSGSTLLVNLLDSHPKIDCEGELLLDPMSSPMSYLFKRQRISQAEVFGFKLQPHHFTYQNINNPESFLIGLAKLKYKTIILKRRNVFRAALSLLYAINSGKFHRDNRAGGVRSDKIFIDPDDLLENIHWIEGNIEVLDHYAANYPHLELIYEDNLLDNDSHQGTINRICDYLGIPNANVESNSARIMPGDFSPYIENAEEIKEIIRKTKYARFLEEK